MSGCSYSISCPNCGDQVTAYNDHKPMPIEVLGVCLSCGLSTYITVVYETLDDLNIIRSEYNVDNGFENETHLDFLEPLTELPEQTFTY